MTLQDQPFAGKPIPVALRAIWADNAAGLIANGYEAIPVKYCDKTPIGAGWQTKPISTERFAAALKEHGAVNVGCRTGHLVAVDIDVYERHPKFRDIIAALQQILGNGLVRWGRKGCVLLYRTDTPMRKRKLRLYVGGVEDSPAIEILGDGQQVVLFGIHPVTGAAYYYGDGLGPDPLETKFMDLPLVTADLIEAGLRASAQIAGVEYQPPGAGHEASGAAAGIELDLPFNIARAEAYIKTKPAPERGNRDIATYAMACTLKDLGVSAPKILEMLIKWVPLSDDFTIDTVRAKIVSAFENGENDPGCFALQAGLAETFGKAIAPEVIEGTAVEISGANIPAVSSGAAELIWPVMTGGKDPKPNAKSVDNLAYMLERMDVRLRWNEFTAKVEIIGLRGYRDYDDRAVNFLLSFAQSLGLGITPDLLNRYLGVIADYDRYHPVREYLASLKWDGTSRVDTWLTTYAGADDIPLHREFGRVFCIGAVRRALTPGCKFDYMLVLEGPQNIGKSKLFSVLGGQWFTDQLRIGMDPKHTIEQTAGRWIVECPELKGMRNNEIEAVKAQITTQSDTARAAYARHTATVPRQFVIGGTTNDATYLRDRTGNRRFLPVAVRAIDIEALERDRDQLWAEAYQRATEGREHAILSRDVHGDAAAAQASRVLLDPVSERLTELLADQHGYVTKEEVWKALGRPTASGRTQPEMNALTSTMEMLGWKSWRRRSLTGEREYTFERLVPGVIPEWLHFFDGTFRKALGASDLEDL